MSIHFNNIEHGYTIGQSAGYHFNPEADTVISLDRNGQLSGGVIYNGYTGRSINVHTAVFDTGWCNRDMLWVVFHYPFIQLGCDSIFGQIPSSNPKAIDFDVKLGFNIIARIDDVFPDGDLIVVRMKRDECRWLSLQPREIQLRS
jgi:hypothetical protein